MSKNLSDLSGRKGLALNLFEELGIAARETGTPDRQAMESLADEFLFGKANVYGTTTFYDFLRPENQGKKVYVCNGSACLAAGTQPGLRADLEKHYAADEIAEMCCLGRCYENQAFHCNGHNFSGNDIAHVADIKAGQTDRKDYYHVGHCGTPVLTESFPGLELFYSLWADVLKQTPDTVLTEIKTSGLRGRGGAGFPMAFKLESCKTAEADRKFIVCNADEGDPGAYSDRYLLEQRPHAVLLGMMIAGYVTGAEYGVLYIRGEYPEAITLVEQAIVALHQQGWIGENVLGTGFNFHFKVIRAQGAYICGEETALLSSIEGQRPEVRVRPPYPTQQGLFNRPTVVNNVETLACLPYILRNGGAAYAAIGRDRSTGTKLVSLDSHFNRPGIYEVDMGTPLRTVIDTLGAGFKTAVKALHIGGPLGGLVPVHKIDDLTVDFESFSQNGFLLGHASVLCIPESFPLVQYLAHLFQFTAHESCGKCFPCRLGSTRGYELLHQAIQYDAKIDRTLFDDLLETLETASLCALGGGLPLPVKNALMYFEAELKEYFV